MMNEIRARGPITCSMATVELFDYGEASALWGPRGRGGGDGGWARPRRLPRGRRGAV